MMDRTTLQIILFLWFGCLCKLTEGRCHHDPLPCGHNYECPRGLKCLGGGCRRCYCEDMAQCAFNKTRNRKFCDCDATPYGTFGPYCECKPCKCPQHYADILPCDDYCNKFDVVISKNLICLYPEYEHVVLDIDLQTCKNKCLNSTKCNFIVWNDGANPSCKLYRLTDFGTNLCRIEYTQNYQTLTRKCRCGRGHLPRYG